MKTYSALTKDNFFYKTTKSVGFLLSVSILYTCTEAKVSNDQEMVQSERNSNSKNRGGKNKLTIRYVYKENIVSRVSSNFPIGGHRVNQT